MYFHVIWLKEKNWEQAELDFLIKWWDENFIRDFLAVWGAVIVSISQYDWEAKDFGNIMLAVGYKNAEIQIIFPWEDLEERLYFFASLGLAPQVFNFMDNPIPEFQMKDMIKNVFIKIKEESQQLQAQQEQIQLAETKKYEERWMQDWLKSLNDNIDRMEQVLKVGIGILSGTDIKKLEDMINEMKKIRLWTNFNKMAEIVFDAHEFVLRMENQIFEALGDEKFLIDRNSYVNNIDVITETFKLSRAKDKMVFDQSKMDVTESVYSVLWPVAVFSQFIYKDFSNTVKSSSANELFDVLMNLVEYFVLTVIIVLSISWSLAPMIWYNFSLYALPAFGWLWLLVYLFNSLKLNKLRMKISAFVILAWIYWYGLILLKNTFVF